MYDFQKADMWKRISAWLFDFILISIVVMGLVCLLAFVLITDSHLDGYSAALEEYKAEFGRETSMNAAEYEALSDEEKINFQRIRSGMYYHHDMLVTKFLLIASLSITLSHFLMEFIIPLAFGNGQTLGKKIFGIAVMRVDGVKVTPFIMFVRSMLGKCTIETLIPVAIIIMIFAGIMGIVGIAVLAALLLSQIVLICATKARTPIHDMLAQTVTADMASQMIFDTPEELLAYKQKIHAEMVSDMREESRNS